MANCFHFTTRFRLLTCGRASPKVRLMLLRIGIALALVPYLFGLSYKVVEKKVLYTGKIGASLTSVVKAANGDLLALFNSGKDAWPGSTAYLMRSTDNGKTWSEPRQLIAPVRKGGAVHTNVGLTV